MIFRSRLAFRWIGYGAIVAFGLFFSGCATLLTNDGHQNVTITTTDGSRVAVIVQENKTQRVVTVPAELSLKSENSDVWIFSDPCFEPSFSMKLEKEFDERSLLNLMLGGLAPVGFAVDWATDLMWEYKEPVELDGGTLLPECDEGHGVFRASNGILMQIDQTLYTNPYRLTPEEYTTIRNLSGLVIRRYEGFADVTSYVTDSSGYRHVVANGNESQMGYELAYDNPLKKKGWYYNVVPRLMQQKITIADFREEIPTVAVDGKTTIPYVVTDFATGQEVDPLDPNRYSIELDAGGVDLMAGANMERVYNLGSRCLMQLGLAAGVTLAEYQHVDLQLGRDRLRESRFQALNAYQGIVSGYFLFPDLNNIFLEVGYRYIRYPEIKLPGKLEFKNSVRYNESKEIFERERIFVDRVELEISTFTFSLGVLF